ncbi:MAG: redoxin domain-containing protein [Prevotella sp.]|nr:redoxin domain-containing protein [Prevotella sp.]
MSKSNISRFTGLIILFVIILVSCNKKSTMYEISGKLENVTGNYFLMSHESGDSVLIDTIPISAKGEFSFKGAVDTLTEVSLYFNQNTKSTYLLMDKGWNVELEGDALYPDLINIKGGSVNDDITAFKTKNKDLLKTRADILNAAEKKSPDNDTLKVKDYVVELKNINFELSNIAANYVKSNPDKIASVMLINTFFKDETSIPRLDENLALLRGKAADFPLTDNLKRFRDKVKLSSVGAVAPNFKLKDLKGKDVQLTDLRGKYVLLSFASTTCEVCRYEKKDAVVVYNELKKQKKNIEFITIVKDIEDVPISKNITDSVKWTVIPVNGGWSAKTFDTYYIREIPYHVLISPTGVILERDFPIFALSKKMDELAGTTKDK